MGALCIKWANLLHYRQHYLDCVKKGALLGADREVMVKEESEEEPEDSDEDGEVMCVKIAHLALK